MQAETKIKLQAAGTGFGVGIILGCYAFYLTTRQQIGNTDLFLILCPPSIAAMALDGAGVLDGIIGWVCISIANAGLYFLAAFIVLTLRSFFEWVKAKNSD